MADLNLNLSQQEIAGVLEALQRFPMNQVRPMVTKIEAQVALQLKPKPAPAAVPEAAKPEGQLLSEVKPPEGQTV